MLIANQTLLKLRHLLTKSQPTQDSRLCFLLQGCREFSATVQVQIQHGELRVDFRPAIAT